MPTQSVASLVNALKGSSMDAIVWTMFVGFVFACAMWYSHVTCAKFRARLASITDVALFLRPFDPFDESHRGRRDQLIRLAAERGWNVVGQYADPTPLGLMCRATGLDALLDNCDRFNLVLAFDVASFGKSRLDPDGTYLMGKLMRRAVGVITLDGSVDCTTDSGREAFLNMAMPDC